MDAEASAQTIDHLAMVAALSAEFCEVVAEAPPDARPLGTPEWSLAELAVHLGTVQGWVAEVVRTGERPDERPRPESGEAVADYCVRSRRALVSALMEIDPQRPCWSFHPAEDTVRFWHRRQLHEVLVHLWDARSALDAGELPIDVDAAVSADGVDEMLWLCPQRAADKRGTLPGAVAVVATDVDRRWVVAPDWTVTEDADASAAAELRGDAGTLLLELWRRPIHPPCARSGDGEVLAAFTGAPIVP